MGCLCLISVSAGIREPYTGRRRRPARAGERGCLTTLCPAGTGRGQGEAFSLTRPNETGSRVERAETPPLLALYRLEVDDVQPFTLRHDRASTSLRVDTTLVRPAERTVEAR